MSNECKVAIVQTGPVYLDKQASLDKALNILDEAGSRKCTLVVFGESWFSGYPVWLDFCPDIALWDHAPTKAVFAQMMSSALQIPGPEVHAIAAKASEHQMSIVLGCNEVERGTIYNACLIFDQSGQLVVHHRKLMPTFTEKMVYGLGDGAGLRSVSTSFGDLTACICWEHFMPMTRQALHDQGETIHVALWPRVHPMLQVASRHYAFEGRCFVIAAGQMIHRDHLPATLDIVASDREWLLNGGSAIYGPDGMAVLPPVYDQDEVIYHTLTELDRIHEERMTLDTTGHYARKDIFELTVNRNRKVID